MPFFTTQGHFPWPYCFIRRNITLKTSKVREWPTPITIQQFLGLASYYRRFIKNFAEIAKSLYKLIEKKSSFLWTDQCEDAFVSLKNHLTSAPTLALPDWSLPFILDSDASDTGIGAVLSQWC